MQTAGDDGWMVSYWDAGDFYGEFRDLDFDDELIAYPRMWTEPYALHRADMGRPIPDYIVLWHPSLMTQAEAEAEALRRYSLFVEDAS